MKCIDCGSKARRRDLRGGRCRKCGRAFAFDPSRDPYPVDDADFRAAVGKVSSNGSRFFTARQLWYELHRERVRPPFWDRFYYWYPAAGGAGAAALGALGVVGLGLLPLVGIGVVAGIALCGSLDTVTSKRERRLRLRPPAIPYDVFRERYLERWTTVHGPLERLVPDPAPDAAPREVPGDVAVFSFDRVVVAQHAETAAMLVANRFHFENGCAVLSLDGYPFGIAETVKEMLRRNQRLTVVAVHDASAEGAALPFTLRDRAWFPHPGTLIVDEGLRSHDRHDHPALPGPPATLPERVRNHLSGGEAVWYAAGNRVELAAARPTEIMWMLHRVFAAAGLPGQPAHNEALARAAVTGGVVWSAMLPTPPAGDTSTDGFG